MPFKSKAQQRFMFARHPEMAHEFAEKTPDMKHLPEKVGHMKEAARRLRMKHSKKGK